METIGPERQAKFSVVSAGHGVDVTAVGLGDLHREHADAAAGPVDQYVIARRHLAVVAQRLQSRRAGKWHRGSRVGGQGVGQLGYRIDDARRVVRTGTTTKGREERHHTITDAERRIGRTIDDDAGDIVARNPGKTAGQKTFHLTTSQSVIDRIHTGRPDLDQDSARKPLGQRNRSHAEHARVAVAVIDHRPHGRRRARHGLRRFRLSRHSQSHELSLTRSHTDGFRCELNHRVATVTPSATPATKLVITDSVGRLAIHSLGCIKANLVDSPAWFSLSSVAWATWSMTEPSGANSPTTDSISSSLASTRGLTNSVIARESS